MSGKTGGYPGPEERSAEWHPKVDERLEQAHERLAHEGEEPTRYTYTWNLPGGAKRHEGAGYGYGWEDCLNQIHINHPHRTNIRRTN